MTNTRVDCTKCRHYFITWDVRFPYGCSLFNIKSKQLPSIIVYQSIGKSCDNFAPKENK